MLPERRRRREGEGGRESRAERRRKRAVGILLFPVVVLGLPSASTSLIMSWSSASVGFCPSERMTVPNSLVVMVPSPSLSKREKASLNSAICSSVSWSAYKSEKETTSGFQYLRCCNTIRIRVVTTTTPPAQQHSAPLSPIRSECNHVPPSRQNNFQDHIGNGDEYIIGEIQ